MTEENKMSQELYNNITAFLKEYGEKNNLKMVVRYNQGSDVMYATDGLDITKPVITGLNERYTESLNKPAADSTAVN